MRKSDATLAAVALEAQPLRVRIADLERQLAEARACDSDELMVAENLHLQENLDVTDKLWRETLQERDEARDKIEALMKAGVTDYSKLTATNRVDCHFCNGVWRTEEPAKHKSTCPLAAILGEKGA